MSNLQFHFSDPQAVARYTEGPPRYVPGLHDLHRMTAILLAEQAPEAARILVLGAGGGMEMRAMADACPRWRFDGVDPSVQMLELARQTLGPHAGRAELHAGYIDDAPEGPFDAAACLLTLHFLAPDERRRTLAELRRRLRPGAPLVVAHSSFPQDDRTRWLSRYAAFALASGAPPDQVANAHAAVTANLQTLSPDHDETILRDAGFSTPTLFYAAFTWRGWIATA